MQKTLEAPAMASADHWQAIFQNWPESIPPEGNLLTVFGDSIPFARFLLAPGMILLERSRPDPIGNRKVMMPFDKIAAVNFTNGLELSGYQCMGFQPPL